ncbi:MIF4G domain-containing protein-like [Dermacentor variabilis]|uniref:MIF4G domain-containing protein-like n=1 Tax=Dermacentor variabilis TaxID=34621 RepID=UPI003F5BA18E
MARQVTSTTGSNTYWAVIEGAPLVGAAPVSPLPASTNGQETEAESCSFCLEAISWSQRQPADYREIVEKAIHDPAVVKAVQWVELAEAFCESVIRGGENAGTVACLCVFFIARAKTTAFSWTLINTVRKWFHRRGELLDAPEGCPRRWTTYVVLVTELFLGLRRIKATSDSVYLAALVCECSLVILWPTVGGNAEMECLWWTLTVAGRAVKSTTPRLMEMLIGRMRDAFLQSGVSPRARSTLLELIELHASGWKSSSAQMKYYYSHAHS